MQMFDTEEDRIFTSVIIRIYSGNPMRIRQRNKGKYCLNT